jgi:hypothetical protein
MDENLKRNVVKAAMIASIAWFVYKLVKGIEEHKSLPQTAKEAVTEPVKAAVAVPEKIVEIAEKIAEIAGDVVLNIAEKKSEPVKNPRYFQKGSPEAKEHMAKMRAKIKDVHIKHFKHKKYKGNKNSTSEGDEPEYKKEEVIIPQEKVSRVMKEFKKGKLKTSAGKKVTKRKQAVAIALSEAGQGKNG